MKKIMFLLAMLPVLLCGCSSDDDGQGLNQYEKKLVGTWVENTTMTYEVFTIIFNLDKSGVQYVSFEDRVESEDSFTWSADKSTLTTIFKGEAPMKFRYALNGNRLVIYNDEDSIEYKRK